MVHPSQLTPVQRLLLAISLPITLVFFYFLFRRSDDEEDEEADARVATSRQTTIELKVPHDSIGAVIGVQGAQIKMIKSTTKARLNFKDKDTEFGKDRILIIQGTQEGAQKAELMVRQIIADQPEIVTVIVQVPNFSVGRIIGRNGETIRSISHQSKAKVNVERTELRDPNALVKVELKGTPIAVDVAKMLVLEKIEAEKMSQKKPSEKMKQTTSDSSRMQTKGDDTFVEVYVSAVEHPGHFWVQYLDRNALNLTKLVYDMTVFYGEFDRPWGENVEPVVGDLVAAPFSEDNSWYRARILGVAGDDVDVYFVDYGDSLLVSKQAIQKLSDEFKELPFQAKECCLADIQPSSGKSWCEEAITVFEDLVYVAKWKVLMSRVISGTTSDLPQLQLIDTNGEKDIDVAEELVRRGLAIRLSENAAFSSRHSIVNQSPGYDFNLKLGGYQTKLTADEVHSCLAGTVRFSHDMDSVACGQDKLLQNSFDSNISLASMPSSVDQDNFSTDFSGLLSPIVGPYEGICDHLIGNSYYDGEDVECHQDFGPAVSCCRSSTPGLPAMPSPEETVNSIESKHLEILSNGDILAHDIDDNDGTVTTKVWSEPLIIKQQTEFPSKVSEQEVVAINDGKLKSSEMSASLLMLDFPKTSEYIDEAVTAKLTSDCGPDLKEVQLQLQPLGKESEVLAKVISVSEMGRLITEATDDKPEVFIELDVQESRLGPENEVIGNDSMLPATDLAEPLSFDIPGAEQLCTHKTYAEEGSHASLSHLSESYPSLKRLIDDSKFRQGLKLHADDNSNVARTIRGQMQETLVKLANEYPTVKDCLSLANPHLELDGDIVEMRCCDKMVEISELSSEVNSSFQECDPPNRQDPSLLLEDSHVDGQSTSVVPDIVSKLCIGDPFVKLNSFDEAITEEEMPVASIEEHGFSCGTFGLDARAKLVNEARSIVIEPDKLSAADDLSVQSEAQCSKVESLKEVIGSIVDNPLQLFDSEEIQKEAVGAKKADYCETDEFPEDRRPEDTFQLHKWTRHEAGPVVSMTVMTENERTSNKREISPDVKEEHGIKCPRADHEYNQQLIESETSSGISKTEFQIEQESLVNPKCSEALQESGINFKKPVVVQESNCDTKESCFIESASIVDEKKMAKLTEKHTPESVNILCNLDDFDLGIYHFDSLCKLSELESGKLKMPLPVACRPEWSTNDYDSLVTYIVGNEQKKERSKDSCAKLIDRHKKHDRAVERRLRAMEESSVKMTKSETLPPNLASRALRSGLLDLDLDNDTYQDGDCDDEGFTVVESRRRRRLRSRCSSEREHSAEIDETHSVLDHDKSQLEQNNCGTADLRPVEIKTVVEFLPPESGQMLQMEVLSENCTLLEIQDLQLNSDHYAALCRLSDFETGKLQLPRKLQCHLSVSYTENSSNDDRKQQMQHYDQVKPCEFFRTNDHADVDRCPTGLVAEAPETRSVGLAPSLAVRAFRSGLLDINLDQHFVDEAVYQDEEDVGCTLAEPRRHRRQSQRLLEIENQGISMIKNQEMVSSPAWADALLVKSSEWEENLITGPLLSKYTTEFKEEKLTDVVDRQDCEANTGKMNTEVEQTRDVELERVFDDRNEPIRTLENLENSVQIQTTDVSDVEQEQAVYLKQQPWLEQITQVENELLREKETDVELDASQLKAKQPSITLPVDQEQVEKQIRTFDLTLATGGLDEDLIRNKYQILHASEPCLRVNIPEPATNDLQSESQDKGICQIDYTDSVFVQTELYVKEVESGESRPEDGLSNVEADDKQSIEADDKQPIEADDKQPIEADDKQPIEADGKQPIEADDKQPIEADDKQEPIVSVSVEKLPLVANELVIDTLSYFYPSLFIFNDFENKLLQEEPDREHECFELADINNIGCTQKISDFKTVDQNDKILELREVPTVGENLTEGAVIQVFTKAAEGGHEMIDKPFFTHKKRTEFDVLNDEHHKIKIEEAETRTRKDQEEDAGTEIIFGPKALEKTEAKGISTEADVCTGVVNKEYAEEVNELSVMKSVENETALCDQDLTLVPEKPGLGVGFISECLFEKIPVQESISLTGNEDQQIIIHSLDDDYRSDAEILNHHFPALCTMAEYESGMMQSKPCIQGFPAQHVNDINALVTCIEGEDRKVKNLGNSHSKADTHEHSKAHRRSKSPEQATKQLVHVDLPPDLASRAYRAGLLDVEAGHGEETIEVDLSGGNGDDFQLVESRKHRRRRNKKSERKQHLDELNLSPVDREQCGSLSSSEIIEQVKVSSVTSLHKEMKVMTIEEHEALNMLDFFQPELNIIKDYFPALCCLAEFESGFISIGSELSKHCQEWETSNIETLVSYVQGDSKKSRMDRKAHSEAHDRSKPHIQSKADERKALQAGLFDVTAGFDKELVAVDVMDDGDDGYTFVESKRHRRQHAKHSEEKAAAVEADDPSLRKDVTECCGSEEFDRVSSTDYDPDFYRQEFPNDLEQLKDDEGIYTGGLACDEFEINRIALQPDEAFLIFSQSGSESSPATTESKQSVHDEKISACAELLTRPATLFPLPENNVLLKGEEHIEINSGTNMEEIIVDATFRQMNVDPLDPDIDPDETDMKWKEIRTDLRPLKTGVEELSAPLMTSENLTAQEHILDGVADEEFKAMKASLSEAEFEQHMRAFYQHNYAQHGTDECTDYDLELEIDSNEKIGMNYSVEFGNSIVSHDEFMLIEKPELENALDKSSDLVCQVNSDFEDDFGPSKEQELLSDVANSYDETYFRISGTESSSCSPQKIAIGVSEIEHGVDHKADNDDDDDDDFEIINVLTSSKAVVKGSKTATIKIDDECASSSLCTDFKFEMVKELNKWNVAPYQLNHSTERVFEHISKPLKKIVIYADDVTLNSQSKSRNFEPNAKNLFARDDSGTEKAASVEGLSPSPAERFMDELRPGTNELFHDFKPITKERIYGDVNSKDVQFAAGGDVHLDTKYKEVLSESESFDTMIHSTAKEERNKVEQFSISTASQYEPEIEEVAFDTFTKEFEILKSPIDTSREPETLRTTTFTPQKEPKCDVPIFVDFSESSYLNAKETEKPYGIAVAGTESAGVIETGLFQLRKLAPADENIFLTQSAVDKSFLDLPFAEQHASIVESEMEPSINAESEVKIPALSGRHLQYLDSEAISAEAVLDTFQAPASWDLAMSEEFAEEPGQELGNSFEQLNVLATSQSSDSKAKQLSDALLASKNTDSYPPEDIQSLNVGKSKKKRKKQNKAKLPVDARLNLGDKMVEAVNEKLSQDEGSYSPLRSRQIVNDEEINKRVSEKTSVCDEIMTGPQKTLENSLMGAKGKNVQDFKDNTFVDDKENIPQLGFPSATKSRKKRNKKASCSLQTTETESVYKVQDSFATCNSILGAEEEDESATVDRQCGNIQRFTAVPQEAEFNLVPILAGSIPELPKNKPRKKKNKSGKAVETSSFVLTDQQIEQNFIEDGVHYIEHQPSFSNVETGEAYMGADNVFPERHEYGNVQSGEEARVGRESHAVVRGGKKSRKTNNKIAQDLENEFAFSPPRSRHLPCERETRASLESEVFSECDDMERTPAGKDELHQTCGYTGNQSPEDKEKPSKQLYETDLPLAQPESCDIDEILSDDDDEEEDQGPVVPSGSTIGDMQMVGGATVIALRSSAENKRLRRRRKRTRRRLRDRGLLPPEDLLTPGSADSGKLLSGASVGSDRAFRETTRTSTAVRRRRRQRKAKYSETKSAVVESQRVNVLSENPVQTEAGTDFFGDKSIVTEQKPVLTKHLTKKGRSKEKKTKPLGSAAVVKASVSSSLLEPNDDATAPTLTDEHDQAKCCAEKCEQEKTGEIVTGQLKQGKTFVPEVLPDKSGHGQQSMSDVAYQISMTQTDQELRAAEKSSQQKQGKDKSLETDAEHLGTGKCFERHLQERNARKSLAGKGSEIDDKRLEWQTPEYEPRNLPEKPPQDPDSKLCSKEQPHHLEMKSLTQTQHQKCKREQNLEHGNTKRMPGEGNSPDEAGTKRFGKKNNEDISKDDKTALKTAELSMDTALSSFELVPGTIKTSDSDSDRVHTSMNQERTVEERSAEIGSNAATQKKKKKQRKTCVTELNSDSIRGASMAEFHCGEINVNQESLKPETEESSTIAEIDSVAAEKKKKKKKKKSGSGIQRPVLEAETGLSPNFVGNEFVGVNKETSEMGYLKRHEEFTSGQQKTECFDKLVNIPIHPLPVPVDGGRTSLKKKKEKKAKSTSEDLEINKKISEENGECDVIMAENGERRLSNEQFFTSFSTISSHDLAESKPTETDCTKDSVDVLLPSPFSSARDEDQHMANDYAKTQKSEASKSPKAVSLDLKTDWVETKPMARPITESRCISEACHQDTVSIDQSVSSVINLDRQDRWSGQANLLSESSSCDRSARSIVENQDCLLEAMLPELDLEIIARDDESLDVEQSDVTKLGTSESSVPPMQTTPKDLQTEDVQSQVSCQSVAVVAVTEVLDLEFMEETEMVTVVEKVVDSGKISQVWSDGQPKMSPCSSSATANTSADSEGREVLTGISGDELAGLQGDTLGQNLRKGTSDMSSVGCVPECGDACADGALKKHPFTVSSMFSDIPQFGTGHSYPTGASLPISPTNSPSRSDGYKQLLDLSVSELDLVRTNCEDNGLERSHFLTSGAGSVSTSTWPSVMYSFERPATGDSAVSLQGSCCVHTWSSDDVIGRVHDLLKTFETNPESYNDSLDEDLTLKVAEFQSDDVGSVTEISVADPGDEVKHPVLHGDKWDSLSNDSLEVSSTVGVASQRESSLENVSEDSLMGNLETRQQMHRSQQNVSGGTMDIGIRGGSSNLPPATQEERTKRKRKLVRKMPPPRAESDDDIDTNNRL